MADKPRGQGMDFRWPASVEEVRREASVSVSRQTSSCVLHRVGKLRPLLVFQDSKSLRKLVPMETFYMLEEGDKNILEPTADLRDQAF